MFWNKTIIDFSDKYFGMDLSDFSIKVFQLEKIGNLDKIRSFGLVDLKLGIIENGKIIDKKKAAEMIKLAIKSAGPKKINTKKVICSVPESKVFLRLINIPKVNEEEAREAIKWEIEANIPLSVDQVYYDWQFLDQEAEKQNVLTVAVSRETIDDLIEVLEMAGLEIYGFEMESVAVSRSLISNLSCNEPCLIVDIGGDKTSFTIVKNKIPCFTSSIPFSSFEITDVIANKMGIAREEAEKIKITQGAERFVKNNSLFLWIKPLLENLAIEAEKTMDFYRTISPNSKEMQKIIVVGGGANLKGLVQYLTTRLSREVIMGDPWINFNFGKSLPPISRNDSLRHATVAGLAMRTFAKNDGEIKLNLIPTDIKIKIEKNRQLKLFLRLEIFLFISLLIFFAVMASFHYVLDLSLSLQKNEFDNLKNGQYEKIQDFEGRFKEANEKISKTLTIKKDQIYWSPIFMKLDNLVFAGITLNSFSNYDYFITISGVSVTRDDLILFKEKLEKEECFKNINLPLSNLVDKNNIEFQMDFEIDKACLKI